MTQPSGEPESALSRDEQVPVSARDGRARPAPPAGSGLTESEVPEQPRTMINRQRRVIE